MKVDLFLEDNALWHRQRDVEALPRPGDRIAWHAADDKTSAHFEVVSVTHVFEDRPWYVEHKDIGGDRICVLLRPIAGPQVDLDAWLKSRGYGPVQAASTKG